MQMAMLKHLVEINIIHSEKVACMNEMQNLKLLGDYMFSAVRISRKKLWGKGFEI